MSSPDPLWTSILIYIAVPHPWVSNLNELTGPLPLANIELHYSAHPWVSNPNELIGLPPDFNIDLHYITPPMGKQPQ